MDIPYETKQIEDSLKAQGVQIKTVLIAANIDRSTWTRWKAGKTLPTMRAWAAVAVAVKDAMRNASSAKEVA